MLVLTLVLNRLVHRILALIVFFLLLLLPALLHLFLTLHFILMLGPLGFGILLSRLGRFILRAHDILRLFFSLSAKNSSPPAHSTAYSVPFWAITSAYRETR